jgi:antitoxin CcdA
MPPDHGDRSPARKRINLTIDEDLIAAAKELGLNASRAAETGLREAVKRAREEEWLRENRAAIEAYNARIEREGPAIITEWTREAWELALNGAV